MGTNNTFETGAFEYLAETGEVKFVATQETITTASEVNFQEVFQGVNIEYEVTPEVQIGTGVEQVIEATINLDSQNINTTIDPVEAALAAAAALEGAKTDGQDKTIVTTQSIEAVVTSGPSEGRMA